MSPPQESPRDHQLLSLARGLTFSSMLAGGFGALSITWMWMKGVREISGTIGQVLGVGPIVIGWLLGVAAFVFFLLPRKNSDKASLAVLVLFHILTASILVTMMLLFNAR
jgi:hypothetical protein